VVGLGIIMVIGWLGCSGLVSMLFSVDVVVGVSMMMVVLVSRLC